MLHGSTLVWSISGLCAAVLFLYGVLSRRRASARAEGSCNAQEPQPRPQFPSAITGTVDIVRPHSHTVEGLEIRYGTEGMVRSVRVGAMNSEHKELLLTMDAVAWRALPNAHKQQVLTAARTTWASKMCAEGPDIAYVIMKTEAGEVIGRAAPHSVTIIEKF